MTFGKSLAGATDPLTSWAAETLKVSPGASATQAAGAFFRELAEADFLPDISSYEAFRVVRKLAAGKSDVGQPAEFRWHHQQRIVYEVKAFAARFFDLPPDARQRRWGELYENSLTNPRALARLKGLEHGLGVVVPPPTGDDEIDLLVQTVCRCFVLDPLGRAPARREFWAVALDDPAKWQKAARRFARSQEKLAALLPGLFERLSSLQPQLRRETKRLTKRRRKVKKQVAAAAAADRRSKSRVPVAVLVGVVVTVSIVRALAPSASAPPKPAVNSGLRPSSAPVVTYEQLAEWFNSSDEELSRKGRLPTLHAYTLHHNRLAYRQALEKLDREYPDVGVLEQEDVGGPASPRVERHQLEHRLKHLERELKALGLLGDHLPSLGSGANSKETYIGLRLMSLMGEMKEVKQSLADLPADDDSQPSSDASAESRSGLSDQHTSSPPQP